MDLLLFSVVVVRLIGVGHIILSLAYFFAACFIVLAFSWVIRAAVMYCCTWACEACYVVVIISGPNCCHPTCAQG